MKGVSHALLGLFAVAAYQARVSPLWSSPLEMAGIGLAALAGALLPDIDSDESTIRQVTGTARHNGPAGWTVSLLVRIFGGHRALTHTLVVWGALSFTGWWLTMYFHGNTHIAIAFNLGYLSHLLADALTVQGVPLLWPWPLRLKLLPNFLAVRTGSVREYLLLMGLGVWLVMTYKS